MNARITAVLKTYLTRTVGMVVIAIVSALLLTFFWFESPRSTVAAIPAFLINCLSLPMLGLLFSLVQHAKCQFIHPRARLMPVFVQPHVAVLGGLLLLIVGIYPLGVSHSLGFPKLGIAAFSALLGACGVWVIHTGRHIIGLAAVAVFFSLTIPQMSGIWLASDTRFALFRIAAFIAGWVGLALWVFRLTRVTEDDDDYFVPTPNQFSPSSRMEKSEARHNIARMISRTKSGAWITDWWHNRLAGIAAHSDRDRRPLLRYGMSAVPPVFTTLWMMFMMLSVFALQSLMLSGSGGDHRGLVLQGGIFAMIGPMFMAMQLADRRGRLAQELLLPMSRQSLVDGLLRVVIAETLRSLCVAAIVMAAAAAMWAPDLLTPEHTAAVAMAMLAILPGMAGGYLAVSLIKSRVGVMLAMVANMYAALLVAGGCYALGRFVGLEYGILASGAVAAAGMFSIPFARRRWMATELG